MYTRVTAAQIARSALQLCLIDHCQTPVVEEVYNKSLIAWLSRQYGEILHECAKYFPEPKARENTALDILVVIFSPYPSGKI